MSDLEEKLGVDLGEKVQLNRRVRKWFRDRYSEYAKKYGSSTCELTEAFVLCLWLAENGLKEFLIFSPKVNFYAQPIVVRYVKKRRRRLKISVENEEYAEVLSSLGGKDRCYSCGSSYHISPHMSADRSSHVFLCPYCGKDWAARGKLKVT